MIVCLLKLRFSNQSTVIAYNSLVCLSLTTSDIEHSVTCHVHMDILWFEVDLFLNMIFSPFLSHCLSPSGWFLSILYIFYVNAFSEFYNYFSCTMIAYILLNGFSMKTNPGFECMPVYFILHYDWCFIFPV